MAWLTVLLLFDVIRPYRRHVTHFCFIKTLRFECKLQTISICRRGVAKVLLGKLKISMELIFQDKNSFLMGFWHHHCYFCSIWHRHFEIFFCNLQPLFSRLHSRNWSSPGAHSRPVYQLADKISVQTRLDSQSCHFEIGRTTRKRFDRHIRVNSILPISCTFKDSSYISVCVRHPNF